MQAHTHDTSKEEEQEQKLQTNGEEINQSESEDEIEESDDEFEAEEGDRVPFVL